VVFVSFSRTRVVSL